MTHHIYQIIISKLFLFYSALFLFVYFFKRFVRINVAINTIWFSENGLVSEHAIENLLQLAKDIKNSRFKSHYQLYFWTDAEKLNLTTKNKFINCGIKIKDYRNVEPADTISIMALQWVSDLIDLGNVNNKLFYVLASDIFRLYLLFKEFPAKYRHAYVLYMDCNDIHINKIPDPSSFRKISMAAFHFIEFNYTDFDIFQKLTKCKDGYQRLLTNDLIAVKKQANPIYDRIFETYCKNLSAIYPVNNGFIEILKQTISNMKIIDDDTIWLIIFSTTHMINILYAHHTEDRIVSLLSFMNNTLQVNAIHEIEDVSSYMDFDRDYDKGTTCLDREAPLLTKNQLQEDVFHRQFWSDLFVERYQQKLNLH